VSPQQLAVLIVLATLGLLVLLVLIYGRPRRSEVEPLPPNFHRGEPDSALEGVRLNRLLVWGFAGTVFIAGFLALYFVWEPFRQVAYQERFFEQSVDRGEALWFEEGECAACHGAGGEGGFAITDTSWPAPPLNNVYARFTEDEVRRVIEAGREGTPMPAWGMEFGGPMNDQHIQDILHFLHSIQVPDDEQYEIPAEVTDGAEVFARECAVCHGEDARGQAMGVPTPTFYAPDLAFSFYRLGERIVREEVSRELEEELGQSPTADELDEAMAEVDDQRILDAGEEAVETTIFRGRPNTPMPGWLNRIRVEQIEAVVEWLREIQQVPNGGT
jgi:mono/diheme cytochrome c family protein